jgi:hypothetical protein
VRDVTYLDGRDPARRLTLVAKHNGTITFTAGALAGILGGFTLGIFFGKYALQLFSLLYHTIDRKSGSRENRFKFEWLLQ